jgi:hypothetical protein
MFIGITMAVLGVMLAFCAAKVGGERSELVRTLVERSNAQAQYHAQDVKHRVSIIAVQELHSATFSPSNPNPALNKNDVMAMVSTVERYLKESNLAKDWSESYDSAIEAHTEAQERYELGQLAAEIGIVIASVALLLKRREAWFLSLLLGLACVIIIGMTYVNTNRVVTAAEKTIEEKNKEYMDARAKDKTTDSEDALLNSLRQWAGQPLAPAAKEGAKEPAKAVAKE